MAGDEVGAATGWRVGIRCRFDARLDRATKGDKSQNADRRIQDDSS